MGEVSCNNLQGSNLTGNLLIDKINKQAFYSYVNMFVFSNDLIFLLDFEKIKLGIVANS